MLIDAEFDEALVKAFQEEFPGFLQHIERGLYVSPFNVGNLLVSSWKDRWGVIYDAHHSGKMTLTEAGNEMDRLPAYGIVDSPKQFMEIFGAEIEKDPGQHAVGFTQITKEFHPGFRWHQNGHYYGVQNPEAESLGDEEHIDEVYTFEVMTKLQE